MKDSKSVTSVNESGLMVTTLETSLLDNTMNILGVDTPKDISLAIQAKEATYKKFDLYKKFADKVS